MKKLFLLAGIAVLTLMVSGCFGEGPETTTLVCVTDPEVDPAYQAYMISTEAVIEIVDGMATTGTAKQTIPVDPLALEQAGITMEQHMQGFYEQQLAQYEGAPGYSATSSVDGNNIVFDLTFDFSVINADLVAGMVGYSGFMGKEVDVDEEIAAIHTARGLTCTRAE